MFTRLFTAIALSLAITPLASAAITLDGAGQITNWNVNPFSQSNQHSTATADGFYTISNDYSPIDYPNGVGHVPSPGGSTGEDFDLEQMHVRRDANLLQVLIVAGNADNHTTLSNQISSTTYYLGDLFLTLNGVDYGIVTNSNSQGLTAGDVYRINDADPDTVDLQDVSRSYFGHGAQVESDQGPGTQTVQEWAAPWAVDGDIAEIQKIASALIDTASFNYGGKEDGTVLIEYSLDLSALLGQDALTTAAVHMAWGCGNDIIEAGGAFLPQTTVIPTPEAAHMGGIGLLLVAVASRKLTRRS